MQKDLLIATGNELRSQRQYESALSCYIQAIALDRNYSVGFNNYGNVLREIGEPAAGLPFLERAIQLNPQDPVARFNRAVCLLLMGDLKQGWPAYEERWNYEHLAGSLPRFSQPRWTGQDLRDRDILVVGEQGHGDCIQFVRFVWNLHAMGARVHVQVTEGLIPLLQTGNVLSSVLRYDQVPEHFDYWVPIMSIPGILGVTLDNLPRNLGYLAAHQDLINQWQQRLGPKTRLRVGFCWSGRRDAWLNQHKGMPFEQMLNLIDQNPQCDWINLQIDCTDQEAQELAKHGAHLYPGTISGWHDTAALVAHMDVVVSVDTAIAHLSGALARPTWVMLQKFAVDWRWLLDRSDSPWYPSARLFRQPTFDDWASVVTEVGKFLSWFKV